MNLIAFSGSRNCVNTQYATLSGAMSALHVCTVHCIWLGFSTIKGCEGPKGIGPVKQIFFLG